MLTPVEIQNKDFKRATIRGYKEDEVEEFLVRVAADYDRLYRENEKLKEQANLNEKEIAQFHRLEKNLQDTLMVAQKTAEEVISSAKKNAEEMRNNTQLECQNIREQAQMDARRRMDEANSKLVTINAEYDHLLREKNAFLIKMRTALESELSVTVQLLNGMPQPKEMVSPIVSVPSSAVKSETKSKPENTSEAKSESKPESATKSGSDSNSQVSSISIKPISSDIPVKTISIDK